MGSGHPRRRIRVCEEDDELMPETEETLPLTEEVETWWEDEEEPEYYPFEDDEWCPPRHWDAGV